jgi:hypothetical protein
MTTLLFEKYESNNDTIDFLQNTSFDSHTIEQSINAYKNLVQCDPNFIKIDKTFYSHVNNVNQNIDNHISENAFINGLIYHHQQLENIFGNILFYQYKTNIYIEINDKLYLLKDFIYHNLYSKSFDFFINNITNLVDRLQDSNLLILVFIENKMSAYEIITKLKKYNENYSLGICFHKSLADNEKLMNKYYQIIEKNFFNYALYTCNPYGNNLIPSIMMYNDINKKITFNSVIKIQSSNKSHFLHQSISYLFKKSESELNEMSEQSGTNCIGDIGLIHQMYDDMLNINLLIKYKGCLKKKATHIIGGTFYCNKKIFDKIIEFMKLSNYKSYFLNNMLDINIVNKNNSPVHFLEKLFGYIDTSLDLEEYFKSIFVGKIPYEFCKPNNIVYNPNQSTNITFAGNAIYDDEGNIIDNQDKGIINYESDDEIDYEISETNNQYNSHSDDESFDSDKMIMSSKNIIIDENDDNNLTNTVMTNNTTDDISTSDDDSESEEIIFNILIRNTYRPNYFKKCIESIHSQTFTNYRIILCYDDKRCLEYLNNYDENIYKMEKFYVTVDSTNKYKFNLYSNTLLEKVKNGWIIFLDDDDKFDNVDALKNISNNINDISDVIFWKFKRPDKVIFPANLSDIKLGEIANCGYCFHSLFKNESKWIDKRCSDFNFFNGFINSYNFNKKMIMKILTSTSSDDRIGNFGNKEFNLLFNEMGIECIQISKSLIHLDRIKSIYNLSDYEDFLKSIDIDFTNIDPEMPCLFFGVYNQEDINTIKQHKGIKYIMFGGSDIDENISVNNVANTLQELHHLENIHFISISQDIEQRLDKFNIDSKLIKLDLVDYSIFYPVKQYGEYIYVYDGLNKNESDDIIYGKEYYDEVCETLPQYDYIFSSDLGLAYNDMPSIYNKCFIALRLTRHDGNANTVQELEAMKIPVIHNHSDYGLKWKSIDDIIKHIGVIFGELLNNEEINESLIIQETNSQQEIEIQIIDDQNISSISSMEQSDGDINFNSSASNESYLLSDYSSDTVSSVDSDN